jgi:hypothetical protein
MTPDQLTIIQTQVAGTMPPPYRVVGDRALYVYKMAFTNARICIGHVDDKMGYDEGYCYQSLDDAFSAADEWDGKSEPPRWFKNLQTNRYRTNGDSAKEYGPDDIEIPR